MPFEVGSGAASLSTRLQQDSDAVQGSRRSHPQLETSGHRQGCLGLGTVFLADAMERGKECDWKLDDYLQS